MPIRLEREVMLRLTMVVLLTGLFVLRFPDVLRTPQFWAEDGRLFFHDNLCLGAGALVKSYAGYHHLVPRLTALAASWFPVTLAPVIFCWVAIALTALVLYLILSPRLELPFRPLLALAVVLTPQGDEVFANITNIQWLLPLGVIALLLMAPCQSRAVQVMEAVYLAIAGLTGPFVLILLPLFTVRTWLDRQNPESWKRSLTLLAVAFAAALVQGGALVLSMGGGTGAGVVDHAGGLPAKLTMMVSAAFIHVAGSFVMGSAQLLPGINTIFAPGAMTIWSAVFFCVASAFALSALVRNGYRFGKLTCVYFCLVIVVVGLFRSGADIRQLLNFYNGGRYFFLPVILIAWFLVTTLKDRLLRVPALILLCLLLLSAATGYKRVPLVNYNWPYWAGRVVSGDATRIPINPPGWFIEMKCP
jgi:hypothetical protein